jgi:hypothetical protein
MFESVRQPGTSVPAADIGDAFTRQRDLLTVSMFKAARRFVPLIRLLGLEALVNSDTCLAYPLQPCPDTALIPASTVLPVLEYQQLLRVTDENVDLRSGSLNIFNGKVGLNFFLRRAALHEFP